jgi:hypothetical protein
MGVYTGNFDWSGWADVCNDFRMNEPEPEEVLVADYDGGGYDGSAYVAYRNGDKYYTVHGSHCSCYGLEDQWEPEEYTKEQLIASLKKQTWLHDGEVRLLDLLTAGEQKLAA